MTIKLIIILIIVITIYRYVFKLICKFLNTKAKDIRIIHILVFYFLFRKKKRVKQTYFIENPLEGTVKIGNSFNPVRRLKQLKTGNPKLRMLRIINKNVENYLHKKFKHLRQDGEFFTFNDEIKKYINES